MKKWISRQGCSFWLVTIISIVLLIMTQQTIKIYLEHPTEWNLIKSLSMIPLLIIVMYYYVWYFLRDKKPDEPTGHDKEIVEYTETIETDPNNAIAYRNRGKAYRNNGNNNKAIDDFSKAIELDPEYGETYSNRAYTYRMIGEEDKASADFKKAKELGYND